MKRGFVTAAMAALVAIQAMPEQVYAHAVGNPYAEDILREEALNEAVPSAACPPRDMLRSVTSEVLSEADANGLLCHLEENLRFSSGVLEYGAADRGELIIGTLLHWGVREEALGRAFTFYDTARNPGGKNVFVLADPAHGKEFNRAWRLVFGNAFRQRILLRTEEGDIQLDVDGAIRWDLGHTAPTIQVSGADGTPEPRVLDPMLSPRRILTLEEWRSMQNAEAAAVLWGQLGESPDVLTASLSGAMLERLRREFIIPARGEVDADWLDARLHELAPESKAAVYARILDIDAKAPWHPLKWRGHSLTGDDTLPDWRADDEALMRRRLYAAQQRLAPIFAYERLRGEFNDDEAFLNAVRDEMAHGKSKPDNVFIDLMEEY